MCEDFGAKLYSFRKTHHLTQAALGHFAGVDKTTIGKIETCQSRRLHEETRERLTLAMELLSEIYPKVAQRMKEILRVARETPKDTQSTVTKKSEAES